MINSKKVSCKDKTKNNFLKLAFKDVGTEGEKNYSARIVSDIKLDFSIKLIPKELNYKKNDSFNGMKITTRPKIQRIFRKDNIDNNVEKYERKRSVEEEKKSKLPDFRRAIKAITMLNKIRSHSSNNKKKDAYRRNTVNMAALPNFVEELHEEINIEEDILTQKYSVVQRNTLQNEAIKKYSQLDNKEGNRVRGHHKSFMPIKNSATLAQMITVQKNFPKKLNTIKTEDIFLQPINYEQYLIDIKEKYNKSNPNQRETFCEGFFISSFPQKDGKVVEKSESFPAPCGHKECSSLPSMKPEIIIRYPLEDTKSLELNNLAATICFPTGIKVCYNEKEPRAIEDYVTPITNQKGERYYMMTYHFYLKMDNEKYSNNYEMHPLKDHLMKFADNYLNMSEEEMNKEGITEQIQIELQQAQDLGFRDYVFIPFCMCLISKYPYVLQMKKCLQSIYGLIINYNNDLKDDVEGNQINNFIMHLINSIPIPAIKTRVHFYIPYFDEGVRLECPKLNDLQIINNSVSDFLQYFSIDNIIIIFKCIIFEKKILFIDDDYTRLSNTTDTFISLLYPFQWMHTYIPIMSDQMLKYLETFLPFLNGINTSLMPLVTELFKTGDMEESEEMFLIYINQNVIKLGSTLVGKKVNRNKYIEENMPNLPYNLEKELRNKLKKLKDDIEERKIDPTKVDLSDLNLKLRNAFIEMFVKMFHDYDRYICFLDDDVVFNKNLFLENIPKQDKKFYDEFIDTQLFQLFTQNIVNDDLNYFKYKINDYNKKGKFTSEEIEDYIKKVYFITPDYLGIIEDQNEQNIENIIRQKYQIKEDIDIDEDGFIINDRRIAEHLEKIDDKKYINRNCNIYIIPDMNKKIEKPSEKQPEKEPVHTLNLLNDILMNETKKNNMEKSSTIKNISRIKTIINKNEMTEKEKDAIKETIKDFTIKIFKSEEIDTENTHLKKDLQNDINTYIGREFFVNLLSKNTNNIILLKDNAFQLLGTIIYNTLLYILQIEENNKVLEQIVILIKSTMFFGIEERLTIGYFLTEEKKNTVTLWDTYKNKFQRYPKFNQDNVWEKWYEININAEKNKKNDDVKKKVILNLCDLMIELKLTKSFIKNTLEKLAKKVFENKENQSNNVIQDVIQKIIEAKYISKVIIK